MPLISLIHREKCTQPYFLNGRLGESSQWNTGADTNSNSSVFWFCNCDCASVILRGNPPHSFTPLLHQHIWHLLDLTIKLRKLRQLPKVFASNSSNNLRAVIGSLLFAAHAICPPYKWLQVRMLLCELMPIRFNFWNVSILFPKILPTVRFCTRSTSQNPERTFAKKMYRSFT